MAIAAGGIFLVALLLSDFFALAGAADIWTAVEAASISGPTIGRTCARMEWAASGCNPGWTLIVPLRFVAIFSVIAAGLCLYRASQVEDEGNA